MSASIECGGGRGAHIKHIQIKQNSTLNFLPPAEFLLTDLCLKSLPPCEGEQVGAPIFCLPAAIRFVLMAVHLFTVSLAHIWIKCSVSVECTLKKGNTAEVSVTRGLNADHLQ